MQNKQKGIFALVLAGSTVFVIGLFAAVCWNARIIQNNADRMATQSLETQQTIEKNEAVTTITSVTELATYVNDEFYFQFQYPKNEVLLSTTPDLQRSNLYDDHHLLHNYEAMSNGGRMSPSRFIFNIDLLTATDKNGEKVSNLDDFLKDYPRRRIHRIREEKGWIGNIPTIEDIWPSEDSGLSLSNKESKTVYALYHDLVYEITITPNSGIPAEMMSTFKFNEPKTVTPVAPSRKRLMR